jgi:hypothetical protein
LIELGWRLPCLFLVSCILFLLRFDSLVWELHLLSLNHYLLRSLLSICAHLQNIAHPLFKLVLILILRLRHRLPFSSINVFMSDILRLGCHLFGSVHRKVPYFLLYILDNISVLEFDLPDVVLDLLIGEMSALSKSAIRSLGACAILSRFWSPSVLALSCAFAPFLYSLRTENVLELWDSISSLLVSCRLLRVHWRPLSDINKIWISWFWYQILRPPFLTINVLIFHRCFLKLIDGLLHFWIKKNIGIFKNNLICWIFLAKAVHVPVVFVNDGSTLSEVPLPGVYLV